MQGMPQAHSCHCLDGVLYSLPEALEEVFMTELEKYQAFHQRVRQRKAEIPGELETLRVAGKGKTVQFKELMAEKLTMEMILLQLRYAGLEE